MVSHWSVAALADHRQPVGCEDDVAQSSFAPSSFACVVWISSTVQVANLTSADASINEKNIGNTLILGRRRNRNWIEVPDRDRTRAEY